MSSIHILPSSLWTNKPHKHILASKVFFFFFNYQNILAYIFSKKKRKRKKSSTYVGSHYKRGIKKRLLPLKRRQEKVKKTRNNRWVKRGFCFGCQADEWGCRPIQPTPEMISPHMVSLYHFVPRLSLSLSLVHHSFLHVIQWICSVYSSIKKNK